MPPQFYVDAWSEWPDGGSDAVYYLLENLPTDTAGDAVGTPKQVCALLMEILNDKNTTAWMRKEGNEMHITFRLRKARAAVGRGGRGAAPPLSASRAGNSRRPAKRTHRR
jgi:hypothetical protein